MIDKDMSSACIQGGSMHSLNMYQSSSMLEARAPNAPWPYAPSHVVKQEPMDHEDKNDSGITSGSEFHSSSPGSDHSTDLNTFSPHQPQTPNSSRFFSPPMLPASVAYMNAYNHPLTPPTSEPLVSPKCEEKDMDSTLTPCSSPQQKVDEDHLRRLEMSLEKSGLFSSQVSEKSMDESSLKSDNEGDEFDEQGLRVPKMNSHGKVKTFKCKQCEFVAITKLEYWDHTKTHIREEKRLTCPKCPFITEYKHHLEYHLRNHSGSKPFKCNKCEYSCVNKSMLNSHMKSHSNIYRYSCRDCSYATKYCHSLKIHLRRYAHQPNIVLDEDGNPCPDLIIDVHGTRRGPKIKQVNQKSEETATSNVKNEPLPFGLNLMGAAQQLPFPGYPFFPNPQLLQNFQQMIRERQAMVMADQPKEDVLDLSKAAEPKHRRKGPAYKLDRMVSEDEEDEEEFDDEMTTTMFSNVEVVQKEEENKTKPEVVASELSEDEAPTNNNNVKSEDNTCQYCNIAFGDAVLYTMHMGYHGFNNPFACNMCGVECADKVAFFLHIARTPHT